MPPLEHLKWIDRTYKSKTVTIHSRSVRNAHIGTTTTFSDCYPSTGCTEDTTHRRSLINAEWKPDHGKLANKTVVRAELAEAGTEDSYFKVFWYIESAQIRHCLRNEKDEREEFDWNCEDAGQRDGKSELLCNVAKHSDRKHISKMIISKLKSGSLVISVSLNYLRVFACTDTSNMFDS